MTLGALLAGREVQRRFGAVLDGKSVLHVLIAAGVAVLVGRVWPTHGFFGGKIGTLVSMCVVGAAYLVVMAPALRPSELRRARAA